MEGYWQPGQKKPEQKQKSAKESKQGQNEKSREKRKRQEQPSPEEAVSKDPVLKPSKVKVSQALLSMKFMQRGKNATEAEPDAKRRRADSTSQELSLPGSLVCEILESRPGIAFQGRRSFGGFNAVIEEAYNECLRESRRSAKPEGTSIEDLTALERLQHHVGELGLKSKAMAAGFQAAAEGRKRKKKQFPSVDS